MLFPGHVTSHMCRGVLPNKEWSCHACPATGLQHRTPARSLALLHRAHHTTASTFPHTRKQKERDAPVIVDIETHVLFPMAVKNTKTHLVCVAGVPPRNRDQVRRRRRDRGQRHGCSGHSHTTGVLLFYILYLLFTMCVTIFRQSRSLVCSAVDALDVRAGAAVGALLGRYVARSARPPGAARRRLPPTYLWGSAVSRIELEK